VANADSRWTYKAELEDGTTFPAFYIRFYPETYKFMIMPHAKNETGKFKVLLSAENELEGYEILRVRETVTITITNNLFPAFKTSPGPHYVRIGTQNTSLCSILNESDMKFNLQMV